MSSSTRTRDRRDMRESVVVDHVVFLDEEEDPNNVNSPSLITVSSASQAGAFSDMTVRPLKRARVADPDGVEEQGWELHATSGGRDWHAQDGGSVLNLDHFLGIRNKKTGTMQLVEIEKTFCLRPTIGRTVIEEDGEEADDEKKTYLERRKELLDMFGGGKSVKQFAKFERNRITEEKLDDNTVTGITSAAKRMKERDAAKGISQTSLPTTEGTAPPHDNDATKPEGCYPIAGLASREEIQALEAEALQMIELAEDPTPLENPGWNPAVWQLLKEVLSDKDSDVSVRSTKLQAAMYFHYLVVLATAPKVIHWRDRTELMEKMAVEEPILMSLLSRFFVQKQRASKKMLAWSRRPEDERKLYAYAAVMWVTAQGFKDCRYLGQAANALGLSLKLFLTYAQRVGCKPKKVKDMKGPDAYRVSLPAPLKFPVVGVRKGRPQRKA